MNHLKDAVTLITGSSSGIGAAAAKALAAKGALLVLAARDEDNLAKVAKEIVDAGGKAVYRVTDVTDMNDVKATVALAEESFGPVEILVNNAGLMLFSYWKDAAVDDWDKMLDVNLRGYLHMIGAVIPGMIDRGKGRVLNMSSVAGIHVGDAAGVYGATKFFIRGVTESLRKEVGVAHGIQVSMVSPGVIDTGWAGKVTNEAARKMAEELNKGAIKPESIAEAVVYALNQPPSVAVADVIVHPTSQDW